MSIRISVCILTKNRKTYLKKLLLSLENQTSLPDQVVIVENNRKKTLKGILQNFKHLSTTYLIEKRKGIAHARNKAIQGSTNNIVSFIDDDCIADIDYIKQLQNSFKNQNIVGILGRSLNLNKENKISELEQLLFESWFSQYLDIKSSSILKSGMFVNARCFSIKKDVMQKYSLSFNPKVPHKCMGIEDTDFGIRLYSELNHRKEKLLYNPKAIIYHSNSTNIIDFINRRQISRRGKEWLLKQHPNFERSIKLKNPLVFQKLQRKSWAIYVLFFIERQALRIRKLYLILSQLISNKNKVSKHSL